MQPKIPIELLAKIGQYLSYTNWLGQEKVKEKMTKDDFITYCAKIAELREIYVWEYKLREKKKMSLEGLDNPMFML